MVTLSKIGNRENILKLELHGLSTDEKPIKEFEGQKISNGSSYTCLDTLDVYFYDEENDKWCKGV